MKKNDGFTLVELLVGILCAAVVTGAAMTLMLMGARTNRALLNANSEQQTARIITTMVESLTSEGDIHEIAIDTDADEAIISWNLLNSSGNTILSYSSDTLSICTGDGSTLMDGVIKSTLVLSKSKFSGSLLNLSIETEKNIYETSAYARSATIISDMEFDEDTDSVIITVGTPGNPSGTETEHIHTGLSATSGRQKFLETLCGQFGSEGKILSGAYTGTWFSEWYLKKSHNDDGYEYQDQNNNLSSLDEKYLWSDETPWCACFVSWGIDQIKSDLSTVVPFFAHVAAGKQQFELSEKWFTPNEYHPLPGDLIFFDFVSYDSNTENLFAPSSVDHVGVVFYCDENYVYTIEGNTSIDADGVGRVDLKRYYLNDTTIKGYGVLDWNPNPST